MDLIERYLQAVKFALPASQQDDIVKELRDSILSQVEEQESELGRALGEGELVELLRKLGSPMQLASRYRKHQSLIGSTLLPIYWKVLKAALGIALIVEAAGSIATAAAGKPFGESLRVMLGFPNLAITVFAWVTLAFAFFEYFGAKFRCTEHWDPRTLAPLVKESPRKSRIELIAQFVVQTIFGVWWLAGLHYNYLIMGPGAHLLNFGPVWRQIYPLFVILVVVDLSFTVAMLYRPQWTDGRRVQRIVSSSLGLIVLVFLLRAQDLFVAVSGTEQWRSLVSSLNMAAHLGLLVAFLINIANIGIGLVKMVGKQIGHAHQSIGL